MANAERMQIDLALGRADKWMLADEMQALHDALRLLASQWVDVAFAYDNNPDRREVADAYRKCASDLARVITIRD